MNVRWPLLALLAAAIAALSPSAAAQAPPSDDFFTEEKIDPAVEIVLAGANGVLAGYNALQLYNNRRRSFAAGAAVITGTIGLVLGSRESANYPALDLVFGAAALISGGAAIIRHRAPSLPVEPAFVRTRSGTTHLGLLVRVRLHTAAGPSLGSANH